MPRADQPGRASLAWPAALTFTLLAPVVLFLLQAIPGRLEQPLARLTPGARTATVRLLGAPQGSGATRTIAYHLKLATTDIPRLVSHAQIELLTTSDRADLRVQAGEIRVIGTACVYRAAAGTHFPVNEHLSFHRSGDCVPLRGTATGELDLTVSLGEIARVEVLTVQPPAGARSEHANLAVTFADGTHVHGVRGRFVDPRPEQSVRRIRLLNHVWQVSPSPRWIWIALGVAGMLLLFGNLFFWTDIGAEGHRPAILRTVGAAAIALALGLIYAVVTPPFHAPDEPAHFTGFKRFMGHPDLYVETGIWAEVMHFERIQFHALEKFGPSDMAVRGATWTEGQAPDPNIRGAGMFYVWRALVAPFPGLTAPELLLTLRAINSAVFALVAGCFVLGAQRFTDVRRPHLLALPLFLVPTLPFFAMHVSNHAPLACAYILVGLGIVAWFLDGRRSAAAGVIIGVGWALGLLLSRSAIPLAPLVGAVLAGRLLLGGQDAAWRSTALFWIGAALPPIALIFADAEYVRTLAGFGGAAGAGGATSMIVRAAAQPWLVVVAIPVAAALERLLTSARERASGGLRTFTRQLAVWTTTVLLIAVLLTVAASVFVQLPTVQRINEAQPPPASQYVRSTVSATLTMFRVSRPDFFTAMSFWGGFGWLETQPHWGFVSALVLATAASLVALLLWIRRAGDAPMTARLLLTLCGFVLSIAAYAYTLVRLLPADLVGRYVIGAYLAMLLVCWTPLAGLGRESNRTWRPLASWMPGFACMAGHAYCLTVILRRYF